MEKVIIKMKGNLKAMYHLCKKHGKKMIKTVTNDDNPDVRKSTSVFIKRPILEDVDEELELQTSIPQCCISSYLSKKGKLQMFRELNEKPQLCTIVYDSDSTFDYHVVVHKERGKMKAVLTIIHRNFRVKKFVSNDEKKEAKERVSELLGISKSQVVLYDKYRKAFDRVWN